MVSGQDRIGHKEHNSETTSDDYCECELFMLCLAFTERKESEQWQPMTEGDLYLAVES